MRATESSVAFIARVFVSSFRPVCTLAISSTRRPRTSFVIVKACERTSPTQREMASSSSAGPSIRRSKSSSYGSSIEGTLKSLEFASTFVDELPGDSHEGPEQRQVYGAAYSRVSPTPPKQNNMVGLWEKAKRDGFVRQDPPSVPRAIAGWSPDAAKLIGITTLTRDKEQEISVLGGEGELIHGMKPYAACYGGHQFGRWAGQLGDGRAIVLGECNGWEVQLKGAGKTPYSRSADGRAVLRSSIREYLCSEAMHFAGIPTTRALSIVTTGAGVIRDMFYNGSPSLEAGAVVTRLAPTFLRLGNFQLAAVRGDHDLLTKLCDYAIKHHFPDIKTGDYVAFAHEVSRRNAIMVARWMAIGFVHGVMNTDNFSILGLTIDYGPYGFLDEYDPEYTPNTTDEQGKRYTYENQPLIANWNICQFVQALVPMTSVEEMQKVVDDFDHHYQKEYDMIFSAKLGLSEFSDENDRDLLRDFLALMKEHKCDWTNTWRSLLDVDPESTADITMDSIWKPRVLVGLPDDKINARKWNVWTEQYLERIRRQERNIEVMKRVNPVYILRNYLAQIAIDKANEGKFDEIERLYMLLKKPGELLHGMDEYSQLPPDWAQRRGVKVNSCSS